MNNVDGDCAAQSVLVLSAALVICLVPSQLELWIATILTAKVRPATLFVACCPACCHVQGWGHDTPLVAQWTGERLMIRDDGQQELLDFRQQVDLMSDVSSVAVQFLPYA